MPCDYYGHLDDVRLLTGDLDAENQLFTDDQMLAFLRLAGGSAYRAAAEALRVMARSEVMISKKITTQDLSTDGPAVAAELRKQAAELDAKADALDAAGEGSFAAFIPCPGSGAGHLEGVEHRVAYPW